MVSDKDLTLLADQGFWSSEKLLETSYTTVHFIMPQLEDYI